MNEYMDLLEKRLAKIFSEFKDEISSIRGARPSPVIVEDINVDYFDQKVPIKQLASIMVVPPREINIQAWDSNAVEPIEGAIKKKLDIQTNRDGNVIHCILPKLTQETKEELFKSVKNKVEDARIKSRVARDEIKKEIDDVEKNGGMSEDDKFKFKEDLQKKMDEFNKNLDEEIEKKKREIDL